MAYMNDQWAQKRANLFFRRLSAATEAQYRRFFRHAQRGEWLKSENTLLNFEEITFHATYRQKGVGNLLYFSQNQLNEKNIIHRNFPMVIQRHCLQRFFQRTYLDEGEMLNLVKKGELFKMGLVNYLLYLRWGIKNSLIPLEKKLFLCGIGEVPDFVNQSLFCREQQKILTVQAQNKEVISVNSVINEEMFSKLQGVIYRKLRKRFVHIFALDFAALLEGKESAEFERLMQELAKIYRKYARFIQPASAA